MKTLGIDEGSKGSAHKDVQTRPQLPDSGTLSICRCQVI